MFHVFLRFGCGDTFCTDTLLQAGDVMHRNLYTEQFLCADTLPQRGLCTDKLLHADAFTHRGFYAKTKNTQKFLHTDALHNCTKMLLHAQIKAHKRIYLHTEPVTQRTFAQNNFYAKKFSHRKALTQKKCPNRLHQEVFTHHFFTCRNFTQSSFCAQTLLRTEAFTDGSLYMDSSFYTDAVTHRCLYTQKLLHTNLCTQQHAFTQPAFTRRGFASPSWSPTFRVPPLKYT